MEFIKDEKLVQTSIETEGENEIDIPHQLDSKNNSENRENSQMQLFKREYSPDGINPRRKRDFIRDKFQRKSSPITSTNTELKEDFFNSNNMKEVYEIVAKVEEGLSNYQMNFPKLDGFPSHFLPSFVSLRQSIQNSIKNNNNNNINNKNNNNKNNNDGDLIIIKDSQKREIIYCCLTEFIKVLSSKHSQSLITIRFMFNINDFDQIQHCVTEYVSQFQKVHLLFFQIYKELKQLIQMLEIEINATAEEYLTKSFMGSSNNGAMPKVNCSNKVLEHAKSTEKSFLIFEQWENTFHSLFDRCILRMERSLENFPPF